MFKKLRQKLEYEDGNEASPVRKSSSTRSLNQSDDSTDDDKGHRRSVSKQGRRSIIDQSFANLNEKSPKEDIFSALMQRTTQVKKLEIKLADYGRSLKDVTRERDKLSSALEKQQDNAMRRLSELNATYTEGKTKMEENISTLEKSENELLLKVDSLSEENERLKSSIEKWEKEKDEFEKIKDEFYSKRDNSEELQDLQQQEMAKVKHLLMNSEKECRRLQTEVDSTLAELLQTRENHDDLDSKFTSLSEENNAIKKLNEEAKNKICTLTKQLTTMKNDYTGQQKINSKLQEDLTSTQLQLQKNLSRLSDLDHSYNSICEKYESLKHSSELVIMKATRDLDEKQSSLTHLQKKLSSFENRLKSENLPEDEQIKALINERTSLENRLEESHQQLNNIKSTWSVKINQLETQVAHLNAKILEDGEDFETRRKAMSEEEIKSSQKVKDLENKLSSLQDEHNQLLSQNENFLAQISELEAKAIEQETLLEIERTKAEKSLDKLKIKSSEVETKIREEMEKIKNDINEKNEANKMLKEKLEKGETEKIMCSTKAEELERQLDIFKAESLSKERVSTEMGKSLEELRTSRDAVLEELQVLKESINFKEAEIVKLQEDINKNSNATENFESQIELLNKNLTKYKEETSEANLQCENIKKQNEELSQEIKNLNENSKLNHEELQEKIVQLSATLESRETEIMESKERYAELKNFQSEDTDAVDVLKQENSLLEEKLLEKDRSLKMQQQKMNDLKKALSRELNKSNSSVTNGKSNEPEPLSVVNGNSIEVEPAIGVFSLDDASLTLQQREVTAKYLKHLILKFLSCGQSEATQLIKALTMILKFSRDEEKLLKEVVTYRSSWFSSKPSSRGILKPSVKPRGGKR